LLFIYDVFSKNHQTSATRRTITPILHHRITPPLSSNPEKSDSLVLSETKSKMKKPKKPEIGSGSTNDAPKKNRTSCPAQKFPDDKSGRKEDDENCFDLWLDTTQLVMIPMKLKIPKK